MKRRSGYTLVEVLVALAVLAIVLGMLLPMSHRHRQTATLNESLGNLRQLGAFTAQYAADNDNLYFNFTWRGNVQYNSQWADLRLGLDDGQAASNQAVDIMRRLGPLTPAQAPAIGSWFPFLLYSTLVLWDYTKLDSPLRINVSPGDWRRSCWLRSFASFTAFGCSSNQPDPSGTGYRWYFSSSYEVGAAFLSADSGTNAVIQSSTHNNFSPINQVIPRRTDEVLFPAQKAHMWDSNQRHFGQREWFFAVEAARVPVLTADGSVRVRSGQETNGGWNPTTPQNTTARTGFSYSPLSWEPDSSFGPIGVVGRQRYTAQGLRGLDFDGDEIR